MDGNQSGSFNITTSDIVTFNRHPAKAVAIIARRSFVIEFIKVMNKSQVVLFVQKYFLLINSSVKSMV
ncbi:hypothetical protein A2532_03530 [Candidatus Wolfebacteria bacterium RIFOXYD2_FULL_48_11]|nr:MAG: hypothetical protein A2532_03530 [Candidatus Wolfebacteria bacterium RIFOXYD2_FULL_48_11]